MRLQKLTEEWKSKKLLLPVWMEDSKVCFIDQIKLPFEEVVYTTSDIEVLAKAIVDMQIRGSGAIGIAGAYGALLSAYNTKGNVDEIMKACQRLKATRPTAVNLMKTIDEIVNKLKEYKEKDVVDYVENMVCDILERQLEFEYKIGQYGSELIQDGDSILTHCNSGAYAGSGYGGRALSVIRAAHEQGKKIHVYTSETRPYFQGARITAYELGKLGIPHTLITDGMSGYLMKLGKIQKVVVGSDRVAKNGDLINKVGTYMHALAAKANGVPFYTATASHTIDFKLEKGMDMPVEFRNGNEVIYINGKPIAPENTKAIYPSFDVTPNELIAGIVTEKGVCRNPYMESLIKVKG